MRPHLPILLFIATTAASMANESSAGPKPENSESWTMFGRDLQNTNHYPHMTGSNYKLAWSTRAGCPAPGMASTMVNAVGMFNTSPCTNTGDTHATSLDGKELWSHGVGEGKRGIISSPCIHEGAVFSADNGYIKAFKADDGSLLWSVELTCGDVSVSSPIAYDGRIFLSGNKGIQVIQTDRTKAAQDTLIAIEDGHGSSTPAFHNGQMIAFSLSKVHSFDTKTLKPNWEVALDMRVKERMANSPVIDLANERIFVATAITYTPKGRLYGLSLKDGKLLWQQETEGMGMTPSITFDGSKLYVASMNGTVSAHDPDNGKTIWTWSMPGESKAEPGKLDHSRILGGLISSKNKLVVMSRQTLFIISNDKPEKIDFEIDLNGFGSPTPAFYHGDLFLRTRTKELGAHNHRYTEAREEARAADLEVSIIQHKAHIRNLTQSKVTFNQFCFGINVNEKQNCVLWDFELPPGEATELDLEQFMSVEEDLHHLLLALGYEINGNDGEFHQYFTFKQ